MVISDAEGEVDLACAHGTIDVPLRVDAGSGRFDAAGTYAAGHGGPSRPGETTAVQRARYSGRVQRDVMTLRITLAEDRSEIGSFTLERGRSKQLIRRCD